MSPRKIHWIKNKNTKLVVNDKVVTNTEAKYKGSQENQDANTKQKQWVENKAQSFVLSGNVQEGSIGQARRNDETETTKDTQKKSTGGFKFCRWTLNDEMAPRFRMAARAARTMPVICSRPNELALSVWLWVCRSFLVKLMLHVNPAADLFL